MRRRSKNFVGNRDSVSEDFDVFADALASSEESPGSSDNETPPAADIADPFSALDVPATQNLDLNQVPETDEANVFEQPVSEEVLENTDEPTESPSIVHDPTDPFATALDELPVSEAAFDDPSLDISNDGPDIAGDFFELDDEPPNKKPSFGQSIFGQRSEPDPINLEEETENSSTFVDEQAEINEDSAPTEKYHVAALQGQFAGPKALSILSQNLEDDVDELNLALAAFADLEENQIGFIRYSIRDWSEFRGQSQAWLAARKGVGEDPEAEDRKVHHKIGSWLSYGVKRLWFEVNKDAPSAFGGRVEPVAPGRTPGDVKPLTSAQVNDEERQAWKDAETKARDTNHYEVSLRIGAIGKPEDEANLEQIVSEVAAGYSVYTTPHQQIAFARCQPYDAVTGYMGMKQNEIDMALSAGELGEIARVPDDLTRPQGVNIVKSVFKQMPVRRAHFIDDPYNPPPGLIPIGLANPGSEDERVIAMPNSVLDQHAYWAGQTGMGKTELMKWFVFGIAKADYPIVVIDPHGVMSEELINALIVNCPERLNDLVLCDLSDDEYPVALNPLDIKNRNQLEPTVTSVMEMLAQQLNLSAAGAPRAVNLARQAIMALCEMNLELTHPENKCTLLHVIPFFLDAEFRHGVVQFSKTVSVMESFNPDNGMYEMMNEKQQQEYVMPIVRAFQPLSTSASFSAVFTAGENQLDFAKLIGGKKIVIVKLARFSHQAKLGEFVGSLILPWLMGSMDDWGRKKDPVTGESVGSGCRILVDEAPTLLGPQSSAIQLLAEARKWDLGLLFVSQYMTGQLDPNVIKATLANTASKLSLGLEPDSAKLLAQAISGTSGAVSGGDIAELPPYYYYANVMTTDGSGRRTKSGPFSAAALKPINDKLTPETEQLRNEVIRRSRELVCNDRDVIANKQMKGTGDIKSAIAHMLKLRIENESPAREIAADLNLDARPAENPFNQFKDDDNFMIE